MDGHRIDALARQFANSKSRRTLLRGLVGGALTTLGLGNTAQARCPRETPIACGGTCVDLRTDPANCGRCGTVCVSGLCYAGRCLEACPSGFARHDGTCVRTCPAGLRVSNGVCVPPITITLTQTPTGNPNFCNVVVMLRGFASNTQYTVNLYSTFPDGSDPVLEGSPQTTTDDDGNSTFTPFSFSRNWAFVAEVDGTTSVVFPGGC